MPEETVHELPISRLSPHPDNVRGDIAPTDAEEMALSILLRMNQGLPGVIQPLVVVAYNGGYRVVDGHVRLAGANRLLKARRWPPDRPQTLPAIVRDLTPEQQRATMLTSNVTRYALNPVDEGLAYERMVREDGLSKSEIADRCGVSPGRVKSRLCIVGLAPAVVEMFRRGELPLGAAEHLAKIADPLQQLDLALTLARMGATHVATIAEACRRVAGGDGGKAKAAGRSGYHRPQQPGNGAKPGDGAAGTPSPAGNGCQPSAAEDDTVQYAGGPLGLAEVQAGVVRTCRACPSLALPGKLSWTRAERIWLRQCAGCEATARIAAACGDCPLALFLDVLLGEGDGDGD
jgi:ParB/RepB/Spo0J family partition protein